MRTTWSGFRRSSTESAGTPNPNARIEETTFSAFSGLRLTQMSMSAVARG